MQKHFINLTRVPERADFIAQEAARIGLADVQFFPAVDAQGQLPKDISPYYTPNSWKAYWELSATEVAVFESHRLLWEKCALENTDAYFICEDDILMSEALPATLIELSKHTSKFDLIHVDSTNVEYRYGKTENWADVIVAPILQPLSSAAAYVVSPSGAKKLAAVARRGFCDHVDDFLTRPDKNYCVFQLLPALAIQGMFANPDHVPKEIRASERTSIPALNRSISKGPISYRITKEIRRSLRRLLRKSVLDKRLIKLGGSVGITQLAEDLPSYLD